MDFSTLFSSDKIIAALIGAIFAYLIMITKDIIFKLWIDNRDIKKNEIEVFRSYADPLSYATKDLLWRLSEIFNQEYNSSYLFARYTTSYSIYKRNSTVFRLAALLGWLRAFEKEITLLKSKNKKQLKKIKESINKFREALADGNYVETERLNGLLKLWSLHFKDCEINSLTAAIIDHEIKDFVVKKNKKDANDLSEDEKYELCKMVANTISEKYKVNQVANEIIKETLSQAIQYCSLKEAWIYRDWQRAIGDLMLKESNDDNCKYEVIGFYEFNKLLKESDSTDNGWIMKVENIFIDLDITGANKADMRLKQVNNIKNAIANLMIALTENDKQRKILMSKTIDLAYKEIKT